MGHLRAYSDLSRIHQHRFRRFLRARPQPLRRRQQSALRHRCHAALEAAAPRHLSLLRGAQRVHLGAHQRLASTSTGTPAPPYRGVTPRRSPRQALRLLRLRRLPIGPPLDPRRPLRPFRARPVPAHQSGDAPTCTLSIPSPRAATSRATPLASGHRRQRAADLHAQRVQPDPHASSAAPATAKAAPPTNFSSNSSSPWAPTERTLLT